jgi:hypothetical protein
MPVSPRQPGVSIEEIANGGRAIVGVATAITAFLGRALRGPVDEAVEITSYRDFERVFGGLWVDSSLGYAVRDFYLNGGSRPVIVRLFAPTFANAQTPRRRPHRSRLFPRSPRSRPARRPHCRRLAQRAER